MDNRPIGVFDSGLGGLTFVRELHSRMPNEKIVYFGDTGRVPYGTRTPATINRYAEQDCRFLLGHDVKFIVAACGTVSTTAQEVLKTQPVPAMGVLEPTAEAALAASKNGRVGILGTTATVRSQAFSRYLEEKGVYTVSQACPLFVSLVENGWIERDNEATVAVARRYLKPMQDVGVDTLILGCTHFPLLSPVLSDILGDGVTLINSGEACAVRCESVLRERDALCDGTEGGCSFYVSDRPDGFVSVAEMFLGQPIHGDIHRVNPEELGG